MNPIISNSLILSAVLFTLGTATVLVRRHPVMIFMGIEMMLNAANLALIAFNRYHWQRSFPALDGQVYAFMVIAIAAAEVGIGLAIIVALFKHREKVDVDEVSLLRG